MMIAMVLISVAVTLIGVGVAIYREHQLPVHADAHACSYYSGNTYDAGYIDELKAALWIQ